MLSHLLVHLPPLLWKSPIALFSMPRRISGTNFLLNSRTSFTSLCLPQSILLFSISPSITPSLFHSKLKTYVFGKSFPPQISNRTHSRLTFSANEPFSNLLCWSVLVVVQCGRLTYSYLVFQRTYKVLNEAISFIQTWYDASVSWNVRPWHAACSVVDVTRI